ncbi:MAG: hypothetical protein SCALA702_38470 [Melioribacteraceae bacterium]|nr:MAG: hypothetical protein SCALA702_38470 [Melioribacteraceae bacterium]
MKQHSSPFFHKTRIFALVFTIFFGFSALFAGEAGVQLVSSNDNSTVLEFTFSGYDTKTISINGNDYIELFADGTRPMMIKGMPELMVKRQSIIIGDKSATNFRILDAKYQTVSTIPVAPSKGHMTRNIDPATVDYTFNDIYNKNEWFPANNIALDEPYIVRDFRGQTVEFRPVQFNAATSELRVCTQLIVEVYNDNSEQAVNPFNRVNQFEGFSTDYVDVYSTLFLNFNTNKYDPIPEPGRLLIIYNSMYENEVQPFYEWKIGKGIPTLMASYPGETGTGSSSIKTYIQNLYNSPEGLTYIILIGEDDEVPTMYGNYEGAASDPTYTKLAGGDAYPDAYISRISPKSTTNLAYILDKIKRYEEEPMSGPNAAWYLKGAGVASNEGSPPDYERTNWLKEKLIDNMMFTEVTDIYDPGASTNDVFTAVNDGRSVINYIGHGAGTYWVTTGFDVADVNNLSNGYKNPFIIDVACQNGDFELNECFEEAWIRAGSTDDPKGAIAVYGSSTNASWVPPCDMQSHAMDLLTNRERQTVGGVCFNGVMYAMDMWGGSSGEGLKLMEQYNIFGDCTTIMTFGLIPDSTGPSTITDLSVLDATSSSIKLGWTSPEDSSLSGVVSYDIRYSTMPIVNEDDFNNATSIIFPGEPDSAGMSKIYELNGLEFATSYYFAIKAMDIWGNTSEMSNVVEGATYIAPDIDVTPTAISVNLMPDQTTTESVSIANVTNENSTLDYEVELTNNTFPENVTAKLVLKPSASAIESGTKDSPVEVKGGAFRGFGGPDAFGYEWIDSDEPNGPDYVWEDISTTGTAVTNWEPTGTFDPLDEGVAGPFDLGFTFKFYGEEKTQIYFSSNSFLTFGEISGNTYSNDQIPDDGIPNDIIAPFWDDMDGGDGGTVYYKAEASKFIVQYTNWKKYFGTGEITMQIVLHKNGKILVYYNDVTLDNSSATIGIENFDASIGLQVAYNSAYAEASKALQMSAEPDWLASNLEGGRIYNGSQVELVLDFNTDGLEMGQYSMDVEISSNDPDEGLIVVPVNMYVGQGGPEGYVCDVTVMDAGGARVSLDMSFGCDANATDGIDSDLGEFELPPVPPAGVFDSRFVLPGNIASLTDIRPLGQDEVTWTLQFQTGTDGYPVTISWDNTVLPEGSFYLQDPFGGSIVNVDMKSTDMYEVTNSSITSLLIVYSEMMNVEMTISQGWNILSVPVHAPDMGVSVLFPDAVSPAYGFDNGYTTMEELAMGAGYWLKFDDGGSHMMTGMPDHINIALGEGWNIVGPFETMVNADEIVTNPAGIIASVFYGYDNGYSIADELYPGEGYWVKASADGEMVMMPVAKKGNDTEMESPNEDALYTISVATADGAAGSYGLMLGIDPAATDGVDGDLGETELPPLPPAGVYDARMILPDGTTGSPADYRTGDNNYTGQVTYTMKYQLGDGGTSMTLDVDIPEIPGTVTMTVQDPFGGVLVNEVVNEGGGQVVVTNTSLTELKLIVDYNAPIPVELSSFAANVVGETIQLAWETATETNNKGFEVERSEDGESFTKVGYIDGNGTTSEKQAYNFTDHHAVSGTYYYRLRQVDFDGTSSYSDAVEVDFVPTEYSLGQNYPNPFNPSTRIKFAVPVDSKVTVTLYNMLGQKVQEIVSQNYSVGLHEVDFNASELSSGMYIYSISAQGVDGSNFVDTKKMMLMK